MKILFITRKYPPSTGGMELFAYDLSNALDAKIPIKLVKWGHKGRLLAVFVALPYLSTMSFFTLLRGGIDVIHVQDGLLAPTAFILAKLFRKPFVVVIHGLDITYNGLLFRAMVPWAVRKADAVVCISQAAAIEVKNHGVSETKIRVIPLAVTDDIYGKSNRSALLEQLQLPEDSQILLSVGRLVKRKGVAWFVEKVLPGLVTNHPKLVFLVAGEGDNRHSIEIAIADKHLEQNVRLLGKTTNDLLWACYNGADVFVMPNIQVRGDMEGFGLVLLEASLCTLPIVASALEGIEEAVQDGKNGVLVSPENASAFLIQVSHFLDDKAYAKSFGDRSRHYTLETYKSDKVAESYIELYKRLK